MQTSKQRWTGLFAAMAAILLCIRGAWGEFIPFDDFTLANIQTGSEDYTNSNEVEIVDFPIPEGYTHYQITEDGNIGAVTETWAPTNEAPAPKAFTLPAADTNITLYAWFTNTSDSVALYRSAADIVYTTNTLPEPAVLTSWEFAAPDGTREVHPDVLDDGTTTGGAYDGHPLNVFEMTVLVMDGPYADQTPAETYATLPPGTYQLALRVVNEAGNVAISDNNVSVTIMARSGPVYAVGGDVITNYVHNGTNYRAHVFTSPVRATFTNDQAELEATTDDIDGVTVTDGMVVYVQNAANADQIGKTFQASGAPSNWTWEFYGLRVLARGQVEYLVVGGGASGGRSVSHLPGGGGAGGYRSSVIGEFSGRNTPAEPQRGVLPGAYPVRVGRGGTPSGQDGDPSEFAGIVALGGGGGGLEVADGRDGGSGGGALGGNPSPIWEPGKGTAGQGYRGGFGYNSGSTDRRAGGGGGGAGSTGGDGEDRIGGDGGGDGGDGLFSSITGTEAPYAGGGGGGGPTVGVGGSGIGGDGSARQDDTSEPTAGVENTGSGGGAGNLYFPAGAGGAGIVVVRYEIVYGTVIYLR